VKKLLRRVTCWKFIFYELLLPALRLLGPARCDAVLCELGRFMAFVWPPRRARLIGAMKQVREALELDEPIETLWTGLAANTARFLARDYALDVKSDHSVLTRFDVRGQERLLRVLGAGQGAVLVGSHMGAYIAGLHWLFRSDLPVRALIQRPRHISHALSDRFDSACGHIPQADLFLLRDLSRSAAIERVIRARAAIREGLAIYLSGDIPWHGQNTQPGFLLGRSYRFLAIWTELAVLTRAPVFYLFCTAVPGGRFTLDIEPIGLVQPGEERDAVADYLKELEARIATDPTQAVPHLLWPCFNPSSDDGSVPSLHTPWTRPRPSHRNTMHRV
jgi:lauroyl/myristoyl acyltransferase